MDKKARIRRIWRDTKNFFRKKTSDYKKRDPQLDLDEMEDQRSITDIRKLNSRVQTVEKNIFIF